MTDNGHANPKKNASLKIVPPEFSLDNNVDDYELWTFRLPVSVPLRDLDKVKLDVNGEGICGQFESNGEKYKIQFGDNVENESFRVLVLDQGQQDSDDEDERYLQPSSVAFSRHLNVSVATQEMSETTLAPRIEHSPKPEDEVRHAYAPVAQRAGLKRRWMPLGSSATGVATGNLTTKNSASIKKDTTSNRISSKTNGVNLATHKSFKEEPNLNRSCGSAVESTANHGKSSMPVQEANETRDSKRQRKEEKKAKKEEKKAKKKEKKAMKKEAKKQVKQEN